MSDQSDPNVTISLRPVEALDRHFLFELYAHTRLYEVAAFGWSDTQQAAFLRIQFEARQSAYRLQYPDSEDYVVLRDNEPAGRLITDRSNDPIVIVDIAIAAEFRRQGLASHLIRNLQAEASVDDRDILLRVDKQNAAAFELYRTMGFEVTGENQIMYSMLWKKDDVDE